MSAAPSLPPDVSPAGGNSKLFVSGFDQQGTRPLAKVEDEPGF